MRPSPEAETVRAAKAGDKEAFERLLGPLIDPAYRLACTMLHDPDQAEDAVQEASLSAWRKLDQLRDGWEVRPWFLGIVANQCRSTRRGKWWSMLRTATPERQLDSPDEGVVRRQDVRRAIEQLGSRQRLVVILYFYLDLPLVEIATLTHQSLPAVRSQLYRAIHRLKPDLEVPEALT